MNVLSKAELDMLRTAYRRDPNIDRVARMFGLSFTDAATALHDGCEPSYPKISPDGGGHPPLRRFAIQRKFVSDDWLVTDEVRRARAAYDLGQVEIATGRDGDWLILYAIPRRKPDRRRRPYFELQPT